VGSLPAGDPRPDPVGAVYAALADGDCDSVAADLADASGNFPFWSMLDSPQHVLLYRAAVYFCAGDAERGKRMFLRAGDTYGGWPGLKGRVYVCRIYRAAASVVYQRPQRHFPCRPGTPPPWGNPQVNPLDPTQRATSDEPTDPATAPTPGS
jgi:hypothetical protein